MSLVEAQVKDLGTIFEEQFKELSDRLIDKTNDLHTKENNYRLTEDKLIQMIIEYRMLVENDEAAKLDKSEQVAAVPGSMKRTFSTLVHLES